MNSIDQPFTDMETRLLINHPDMSLNEVRNLLDSYYLAVKKEKEAKAAAKAKEEANIWFDSDKLILKSETDELILAGKDLFQIWKERKQLREEELSKKWGNYKPIQCDSTSSECESDNDNESECESETDTCGSNYEHVCDCNYCSSGKHKGCCSRMCYCDTEYEEDFDDDEKNECYCECKKCVANQ